MSARSTVESFFLLTLVSVLPLLGQQPAESFAMEVPCHVR